MSQVLELYRSELGAELRSIIGTSGLPLYDMMRYHLGWTDHVGLPEQVKEGKLWRPVLCLLACQAVGGSWQTSLPAAAAVELGHNFSLVHDDIEDASSERRHRPTLWRVWGQAQAINVGDALHVLARLALLRLEGRGVAEPKILRAVRALDEACLQLCEGQYLDIAFENRLHISVEDYLRMISLKTAALFEVSLHLGSFLGTDDKTVIEHLRSFGRNLGMAYQIRDDLLAIWGEEKTTGKPSLSDVRTRKKTLPIVYGLERAEAEEKERLLKLYRQEVIGNEDAVSVVKILDRLGVQTYTQSVVERYYHQALSQLETSGLAPSALSGLRETASLLLGERIR